MLLFYAQPQAPHNEMRIINSLAYFFLGSYYILFCVAHWVFAMKYWIVSYKLNQGSYTKLVNSVFYLGIVLNTAFPIYEAVENGLLSAKFNLSYELLIFVQIFSCLVQFDASRRISSFIKRNKEYDINVVALCTHVGAYFIYLVGLILFYVQFIKEVGLANSHQFLVCITYKVCLSDLSDFVLITVFYGLIVQMEDRLQLP